MQREAAYDAISAIRQGIKDGLSYAEWNKHHYAGQDLSEIYRAMQERNPISKVEALDGIR